MDFLEGKMEIRATLWQKRLPTTMRVVNLSVVYVISGLLPTKTYIASACA